mmetsp:Transcript_23636/g.58959  ORF Transcript_23636/g.58959 Transcript_23636/m.58959 type:complete len:102 (+) Transcript_23636:392-697(+)
MSLFSLRPHKYARGRSPPTTIEHGKRLATIALESDGIAGRSLSQSASGESHAKPTATVRVVPATSSKTFNSKEYLLDTEPLLLSARIEPSDCSGHAVKASP